jgi:transmembrane sensor
MATPSHISAILARIGRDERLSESDQQSLQEWLSTIEFESELLDYYHFLGRSDEVDKALAIFDKQLQTTAIRAIPARAVHRVHFLKTAWFRYAAAIIILFGVTTYFWINNRPAKPLITQMQPVSTVKDIQPGGNRAVLTLSDGRKIELDSMQARTYIKDGDAGIASDQGRLTYKGGTVAASNTMTTPKGGRYQLTLADGSKVWLNAASSITYPTAFTGSTRKVSVTGEAYFEISADARRPFIVSNDSMEVIVFGTHFNVNSYQDNGDIKVTLLEGSVKVKKGNAASVLKPGQQAKVDQQVEVVNNVNIAEVMAWKNGVFNFNRLPLKDAMNEIARWYDVDVVYQGDLASFKFYGKMGRDLTLKQVLSGLSGLSVQFNLTNEKTIVISPNAKIKR